MDITCHPCFSDTARHKAARIHLPVAPKCNIQCNYCRRDCDCVNESRPGVTSTVLTPSQALSYLDSVMSRIDNIAVVGIAGPGDPFANSLETMETLRLVRERYPEMLLCVATNGLNLPLYVDELARLKVSHVTITLNAVDAAIGERIYAWAKPGIRILRGREAAYALLDSQTSAIQSLKGKGITVKINTIVIPGINDAHIPEIARYASSLGADIMNCIPLYHVKDTPFEKVESPGRDLMDTVRTACEKFLPNMRHCSRCRADAAGLIGQACDEEIQDLLKKASRSWVSSSKPYIAVASREGLLVNRHLGEAKELWIYGRKDGRTTLIDCRPAPPAGGRIERWRAMADMLHDCNTVLVNGIGSTPQAVLEQAGVRVLAMEGLAAGALEAIFNGDDIPKSMLGIPGRCGMGAGCSGTGTGCG